MTTTTQYKVHLLSEEEEEEEKSFRARICKRQRDSPLASLCVCVSYSRVCYCVQLCLIALVSFAACVGAAIMIIMTSRSLGSQSSVSFSLSFRVKKFLRLLNSFDRLADWLVGRLADT